MCTMRRGRGGCSVNAMDYPNRIFDLVREVNSDRIMRLYIRNGVLLHLVDNEHIDVGKHIVVRAVSRSERARTILDIDTTIRDVGDRLRDLMEWQDIAMSLMSPARRLRLDDLWELQCLVSEIGSPSEVRDALGLRSTRHHWLPSMPCVGPRSVDDGSDQLPRQRSADEIGDRRAVTITRSINRSHGAMYSYGVAFRLESDDDDDAMTWKYRDHEYVAPLSSNDGGSTGSSIPNDATREIRRQIWQDYQRIMEELNSD
jgi:hypothetical protein